MAQEIHSADELLTYLRCGGDLTGIRLQGVDLSGEAGQALQARRGALCEAVILGGGPGAMEDANLGDADRTGRLDDALARLRAVPGFRPDVAAWARTALEANALLGDLGAGDARSVGIPTWFYGNEPPNVFSDVIAKYFSNALR